MHRDSIERKASLLLACLFTGCILGGCHNAVYSSPQPRIRFEKASTRSTKHTNLKPILHDYTFKSRGMHYVVQSDFNFRHISASDNVPRTTPKRSLISGYKFIPYYEFDNKNNTVDANQDILPISDLIHPDSDRVLDYYIQYSAPSAGELKFKESYTDGIISDKANTEMLKRNNPSRIKQITYKLHSISKSSTEPKHLKLTLYPTKETFTDNTSRSIPKSKRDKYPLRLTTYKRKHCSHKKLRKHKSNHAKHPGKLPYLAS